MRAAPALLFESFAAQLGCLADASTSMSNFESSPAVAARPLPGTGRLGVVSAYFTVYGVVSGAVAAGMIAAILFPRLGWHITPSNPWLAIPVAALLTFGFLRTTRLLRQRKKTGAYLAATCLASSLVASIQAREFGWIAFGLPLVGLGLLASVWRHLE